MEAIILVIIRAALFYAVYRIGCVNGALVERIRRDRELDERVSERLQSLAKEDAELWETEIDA